MNNKRHIEILGIKISVLSLNELLIFIKNSIQSNTRVIISYVNIFGMNLAYNDNEFRNFLSKSDAIFCDGFGIKIAAKMITGVTLNRFTPPDWFDVLAEQCVERGDTLFFIGTKKSIIEEAARAVEEKFPGIQIVGTHHGFFNKAYGATENKAVLDMINKCHPDILVVGFGMPLQEKWIAENFNDLNVKVIIPVGAFFDYRANAIPRAPRWMTDHGLEWLGRLIIEPKRLWKRYLIGNPLFFWRIFKHHIFKKPLPFKNCVE